MTVTITIGNSQSRVAGLTVDQLRKIRHKLSYEVSTGKRVYRYKVTNGRKTRVAVDVKARKSLVNKRGDFPTGLLPRVEQFLAKSMIPVKVLDSRVVPDLSSLAQELSEVPDWFTPLAWQHEAATACLDADRGILRAPTGTGKSFLACMMVLAFQVRTLIVVPSLTLKRQLTKTLNEFFGPGAAGPLHKRKAAYPITVENVDALRLTDDLEGVDLLIVDEFHHAAAATYRELDRKLFNTIYWKFGLTATPFRSNSAEQILMESVLSKVIYSLTYDKAVADGLICPMEVFSVSFPKPAKMKAYADFHEAYKQEIVNNEARNKTLVDMIQKCHEAGKSSLVLCRQIEHGKKIQDMLLDRGLDVPFAEGTSDLKDHDIDNFIKQIEPTVIGTVGVMGEGTDTKPAEYIFIAGAGKAKVQLAQNLGRGFRLFPGKKSCKVFLMKDQDGSWLQSHYEQCCEHIEDLYDQEVMPLPDDWLTE